jgi:aldose 1-epimerase
MDLSTTQRGVHFYTAHFMDQTGKGGKNYAEYSGFALETENFPNAVNVPNFPSVILKPGERYKHQTMYKFSVVD